MSQKRLLKELGQLHRHPPSTTNPHILTLQPKEQENIFEWEAVIAKPTPQDSPYYYYGQWRLDISVGTQYPIVPPTIKFSRSTPINHPNINIDTGEICLDILKSENWSPAWNLQYLVVAILMLIDEPEPDSPLNIDLANLYRHDKVAFESLVQYTMWKNNTLHEIPRHDLGVKPHPVKKSTASNLQIIQDVGDEVTKQFIAKVNEIGTSNDAVSPPTKSLSAALDSVRQQVTQNVTKQVEHLYLKSLSPQSESDHSPPPEDDENVAKIKQQFLKQVDDKVEEVRRQQAEHQRRLSDNL